MADDVPQKSWIDYILRVGVPSAIALYLVYYVTTTVSTNTAQLLAVQIQLQSSLESHMKVTESMLQELKRGNLINLQNCAQAAKTESAVRACFGAAQAGEK